VTATGSSPIVVYWRPGCPYCAVLRRQLRRLGVQTTDVNIWDDPAAAAAVRGYAGGNETVPTVVVAGTAMVNPRAAQVIDAARRLLPGAVCDALVSPPSSERWPSRVLGALTGQCTRSALRAKRR
jgi:mycoredoxin